MLIWKYISNWFLTLIDHLLWESQEVSFMMVPTPPKLNIYFDYMCFIQFHKLDPTPDIQMTLGKAIILRELGLLN